MRKQIYKPIHDAMLSLALWHCVQGEMKALKKANRSASGVVASKRHVGCMLNDGHDFAR